MLTCELCVYEERRERIPCHFRRWTDYEKHMADYHNLKVEKSGEHTTKVNPESNVKSDEL